MSRHFFNRSLRTKLILPVMVTMALSLGINLILFGRINNTVENMDQVYATNIRLSELERLLTEMVIPKLLLYRNLHGKLIKHGFLRRFSV